MSDDVETEDVRRVFDALQATRSDDEDLDGAVLVGFAAVAEWVRPDGGRHLSIVDGRGTGERLERWQTQGYFFNVLHDPAWHPRG